MMAVRAVCGRGRAMSPSAASVIKTLRTARQ